MRMRREEAICSAIETRKARAKALFSKERLCPLSKPLTLDEAALAIGTASDRINDVFRARKFGIARLRFDFREHEVRVFRRRGSPPLLPSHQICVLGSYLLLKERLRKSREFELVSDHVERSSRNLEMLREYVHPRVKEEAGVPCIFPLSESRNCAIPIHEFEGTLYARPGESALVVFCAKLSCGTASMVMQEFKKLKKEVVSCPDWEGFSPELSFKLWFLRQRYSSGDFASMIFPATAEEIARFLESRKMVQFFSGTFERYFPLPKGKARQAGPSCV